MSSSRAPLRAVGLGIFLASLLVSCGREVPAPTGESVALARHGLLSFEPVFPRLPGGASLTDVVQFEKVRVVLRRADGSVALDTTVLFPVGADSVVLTTSVPLSPSAGSSGENFKLDLGYMNAAGEVVFKGGPVDLTVVPKGSSNQPAPVQIPIRYSGPGATATKVTIAPRSVAVTEGQAFAFTAVATDASGTPFPNAPIVWASLDPAIAVLGSSTAGAGMSLGVRGTARIVAQLLTGPADTALVIVTLSPKTVSLLGGDAQKGMVNTPLAQPIAVKVTASDGSGVGNVNVAFSVATGGGSVANATVTTDAAGVAATTWTLGSVVGEQTAMATAAGLAGSPVAFKATARSVAPVRLVIASGPPATNAAGSPLPLTVHAVDAQGDIAKSFNGIVTLALSDGPPSVSLLGTSSMTAVSGVAAFTNLKINVVGTGYALRASANGLHSATTSSFAIVPGPAQRLEFGSYPVFGMQAGAMDAVAVIARDAVGNVATGFTGAVSISMLKHPPGTTLDGVTKQTAVSGIATFENLSLTVTGEYQFEGSAPDVMAAKGPVFPVTPGPAARLVIVAGSGQVGAPGASLTRPVTVGLSDRFGNRTYTSGVSVTFAASSGGSTSPSSGVTDAGGQLSAVWTLGSSSGTQTLTASSAGLGSASVTAIASGVAVAPTGGDLVVIEDWNWGTNAHGLVSNGSVYPGNVRFIKNLVNFTPVGVRASATKVLSLLDRPIYPSLATNFSVLASIIQGEGFTPVEASSHSVLTPVASDVKLILLVAPGYAFTTAEINALKTFSSEGGRIVYVGENGSTYPYQSTVENPFLVAMGSSVRSNPMCDAPGVIVTTLAHALTTGISASGSGGFYMNCSSYLTGLGASDVALFRSSGNNILGAVVAINRTLLPLSALRAPMRAPLRASTVGEPLSTDQTGLIGGPDGTAIRRLPPP